MSRNLLKSALAAAAFAAVQAASAAYVFVGSWEVDDGPDWPTVPLSYTGQEAAALLFGGAPADYAISTISNLEADIDFLSWVSTWGGACGGAFPCGTKVAQNFEQSSGGLYQNVGDTSAYVQDWAVGSQYTNFAFRQVIPAPATLSLALAAVALIGVGRARRAV